MLEPSIFDLNVTVPSIGLISDINRAFPVLVVSTASSAESLPTCIVKSSFEFFLALINHLTVM